MKQSHIDIDKIAKTKDIDPKVVEVYRELQRYMDAPERTEWKNERQGAWEAVAKNKMWTAAEEKEMTKAGQVPLVINKCSKGVQGSAAVVTDSKPDVKFFPVGSGDLYVADLLQRAHNHVWAKNEGQDVIYDGVEEAKVGGITFFRPWFDDAKGVFGRVMFEAVPDPTTVYWSKDSKKRDMSDTHLILAQKRTKRYIKDNYEDIKDEDLQFGPLSDDSDNQSEGVTGGDNYAEKSGKNDDSGGEQSLKNIWEIEAWLIKKEKENVVIYKLKDEEVPRIARLEPGKNQTPEDSLAEFEKGQGENLEDAKLINRRVENRYKIIIVGAKLIEEEKNPFGVDADGDPVPGLIPLKHDRTLTSYPTCPTFKALPINKEKNKRRAQYIYAASMDINSPIIEPAGAKWVGTPGTPGSRIKISKSTTVIPQRLQSGAANIGAFLNLEAEADKDIDDMYDLPDVLRGKVQPGQENASGRFVLALQDSAGLMSKPFLRKVESAIIRLARADMALILKHWPRYMWERLLEEDEYFKPAADADNPFEEMDDQESPEAIEEKEKIAQKWLDALEKIRPANENEEPEISLLDLDVRLAVGSSLPTNRMAKASVAIELVKSGIYDPQAALDYVDDPQKDKITARLKKRQEQEMQANLAGMKK